MARCPIAYAHHASKLDGWRSQNGPPMLVGAPAAPALWSGSTGRRVPALSVVA